VKNVTDISQHYSDVAGPPAKLPRLTANSRANSYNPPKGKRRYIKTPKGQLPPPLKKIRPG
jgi:hypothetical protein